MDTWWIIRVSKTSFQQQHYATDPTPRPINTLSNAAHVAHAGVVNVNINAASIDFGHGKMNEHAKGGELFDVAKYPTATYTGKFSKFNGDKPTEVQGELTLHGVTKPVTLTLNSFLCKPIR